MIRVKEFPSIVNSVLLIDDDGAFFIRKIIGSKSKTLDIQIPQNRIAIEIRCSELTRTILANCSYIKTPKIITAGSNHIDLEYIPGRTLANSTLNELPNTIFFELGSALAKIENYLWINSSYLFSGLMKEQQTIREILQKLKTPVEPPNDKTVSLGDVGINNIIIHQNLIYLIDFEFCHIASRGRDVGQLSAQLSPLAGGEIKVQAILSGYFSQGGSPSSVEDWRNSFKNYYQK